MKFKDMEDQIVVDQYGDGFIRTKENTILVGEQSRPCMVCGEKTKFIDIYSKSRFCSEECVKEFYENMNWEEL